MIAQNARQGPRRRHERGTAIIGSGPNGLAAAVTLARAGVPVTLFESAGTIGGGTRTSDYFFPGVVHDFCSSIHPMALASEFFTQFELTKRIDLVIPEASYANPLDSPGSGGRSAVAYRDIGRTASELGRDGPAYARFYGPLLDRLDGLLEFGLGGSMLRWPRSPFAAISMASRVLEQGTSAWNLRFHNEAAPALISGVAAHSIGKMPDLATAGVGMILGVLGHTSGWPVPVGGSSVISDALASDFLKHGGRIETGHEVKDARELDQFGVLVFDTSARDLARIAGDRLPLRYRSALEQFRFGDAAAKVDFVLSEPIPWADSRTNSAPTVHLGGSRAQTALAEAEVAAGRHPDRPFVLLSQPAAWDPTRNPDGYNAVTSYAHVPAGSPLDMTEHVIKQIERFAPGFRDCILGVKATSAADLELYNPNYGGGDFSAGKVSLKQLISRPTFSREPWRTPANGVYLCSSSTPPGPGVHGLSGWYAAKSVLRNEYGLSAPKLSP